MNKPQFDKSYWQSVRRWNELGKQATRTWREQQEFEYLGRQLDGAELRYDSLRGLTEDYDETMALYQAGNLGPVEL
jgi:hypothetical protein